MSFKTHFSQFLGARPGRLYCAGHAQHPWPNASMDGQLKAWAGQAEGTAYGLEQGLADAQVYIARVLGLEDGSTIRFAASRETWVLRALMARGAAPLRVLTTDSEAADFSDALELLEARGRAKVSYVPQEPFNTLGERLAEEAGRGKFDLVWVSQVFANTGYWLADLAGLVQAAGRPETQLVIDGHLGFMAVPFDLSPFAAQACYLAGSGPYAMAGEGLHFLHQPPAAEPEDPDSAQDLPPPRLPALDASALYRLIAVLRWASGIGLEPGLIHVHAVSLQDDFLKRLDGLWLKVLNSAYLLPPQGTARGNFLTFRHHSAPEIQRRLEVLNVETDCIEDRLRINFGIHLGPEDMPELAGRIQAVKI
jgi:kynureninase